jgi:hypothetical protein
MLKKLYLNWEIVIENGEKNGCKKRVETKSHWNWF